MKATLSALAVLVLSMSGCTGRVDETASGHEEEEGWAVTAWGEHYEIFAEADPLVVGSVSKSHTHVTVLDGFPPLKQGSVAAILRDPQGREHAYRQESALRDGIYSIEIKPGSVGTFDLFFEVESAAGTERIAAGTVHVAEDDSAGGLVAAPRYGPDSTGFVPVGEPASFLKEQQWRIPFGTEWAHRGVVRRTVSGPARIRPAAGGEALLVAPVAGIVASTSGTFVGMDVGRNTTVIRLTPRVASDRSVAAIRSELGLARSRVKRLEELFEVEAVSVAELEEARARVRTLASEAAAAGGGTGEPIAVRSPLAGRVAELAVVPGQAVDAGDPLARIVRPNPLWIEVALSPADAGAVGSNLAGMVVRPPGNLPPVTLSQVRLVSRSPEVDRSTGSIALIVEARTGPPLSPGMAVTADVLLPNEREGIVLPATAVIDDGGVPVVYVQLDGESFVRQEVRVLATEGERVLVEGVAEWTRVVTLGGAAIRRAALLRSGPPEGHVH